VSKFRQLVGASPSVYQAKFAEHGAPRIPGATCSCTAERPPVTAAISEKSRPLDADMADAVRRSLESGTMGRFGLTTTDCHETYRDLVARVVEFTQPPAERPYGIEAVIRESFGANPVLQVRDSRSGFVGLCG
jgi:hypothetical protein